MSFKAFYAYGASPSVGQKVGSSLALFCIRRVNRVNSRNDSESWWQRHKHCPAFYYYYYHHYFTRKAVQGLCPYVGKRITRSSFLWHFRFEL